MDVTELLWVLAGALYVNLIQALHDQNPQYHKYSSHLQ